MPKQKTHRGAAKRLSKTGTGKIRHAAAGKRHLLTHKKRSRKRRLLNARVVGPENRKQAAKLIPYK